MAAGLTPANAAANEVAPRVLRERPPRLRFLLGDTSYDDGALHEQCAAAGRILIPSRRGSYPHKEAGVEVRRLFHQPRSHAIENFNGQFKASFDTQGQVAKRGVRATRRSVLGAVLVYQLTRFERHQLGRDLCVGLKPF